MLGIDPDAAWRHETVSLLAGDVLLIYTDGLTDATNFRDEFFAQERVEQAAGTAIEQGMAAGAIARHVLWELRRFTGLQTRPDDLTLIVIKVSWSFGASRYRKHLHGAGAAGATAQTSWETQVLL